MIEEGRLPEGWKFEVLPGPGQVDEDESAASLIESSCLSRQFVGLDAGTWHDVSTSDESDRVAVEKSVRYLELRKTIRRRPDHPNLVQIL